MRTASVSLCAFKPEMSREKNKILIQVHHPTSRNLLGYILFKYDNNKEGTIEMTNFNAKLQLWHLSLGGTSKSGDGDQSGQHGEGFKMAALVLRRRPLNYSVCMTASSFRWNFLFNKNLQLVCRLTRVPRDKYRADIITSKGKPRTTIAHVWEDVSVIIGQVRESKSSDGTAKKTKKVPLSIFENMIKVTLDLNPPASIQSTPHGDLIDDEAYTGQLYLRGLLLPNSRKSTRQYTYSYNFIQGSTGRDRDSLLNAGQERKVVLDLWSSLVDNESRSGSPQTYTKKLAALLEHSFHTSADVAGAEEHLTRSTAVAVWKVMRVNVGNAFFIQTKETTKVIQ